MKYYSWVISNMYGYLFGFKFLVPIHHQIVNLSLHAIGYDNSYMKSWTGEESFVRYLVSKHNIMVCLDVGANIGNYTKILLKNNVGHIYAIEPTKSSFECLNNVDSTRVTKIRAAISDYYGEATIYSDGDRDEKASLDRNVRDAAGEPVSVMRVSDIVSAYSIQQIDFIKIDTEGYEFEVIKGFGDSRPKFIQFEFNIYHLYRKYTLLDITLLLPRYRFYRLLPHDIVKINPKKYINNIFMFSNIVAVRDDILI